MPELAAHPHDLRLARYVRKGGCGGQGQRRTAGAEHAPEIYRRPPGR